MILSGPRDEEGIESRWTWVQSEQIGSKRKINSASLVAFTALAVSSLA
jgi:hypothetical protein